jgi:hypothetical protein
MSYAIQFENVLLSITALFYCYCLRLNFRFTRAIQQGNRSMCVPHNQLRVVIYEMDDDFSVVMMFGGEMI